MSDTFTASNGRQIECDPDVEETRVIENRTNMLENFDYLNARDMTALREFFLHERDKGLGRWRWPENPQYVVYPSELYLTPPNADLVTVVNERNGQSSRCRREDDGSLGRFSLAAAVYFAAHPEPRPWHDAKPGEVWEMTFTNGQNMIGLVTKDGECFVGAEQELTVISSTSFTGGRRIWPEVTP